jgi:hypothetical protein
MRRCIANLAIVGLLLLAGGCAETLVTGYAPHKLSSSDAERRAYYAPPFSPEANAREQEKKQQNQTMQAMPHPSGM